jgi:alternate signal-mediated exported protein
MNKLVKGSIAGAAGIALLLGGAGTLASWNSSLSDAGSAATITAGTLSIAPATSAGVWTNEKGTVITNIAGYRIVPGAALTYTKTFNITATGDNLKGTIALTPGAITSTGTAGAALAGHLQQTATFTVNGAPGSTFVAAPGTQPVVVSTTITFANGAAGNENLAMGGAVSLASFGILVSQTV